MQSEICELSNQIQNIKLSNDIEHDSTIYSENYYDIDELCQQIQNIQMDNLYHDDLNRTIKVQISHRDKYNTHESLQIYIDLIMECVNKYNLSLIWDPFLSSKYINRFSYGCFEEQHNLKFTMIRLCGFDYKIESTLDDSSTWMHIWFEADQLFKQLSVLGYVRDHTDYSMNMYIIITLTDIILCIEIDNI